MKRLSKVGIGWALLSLPIYALGFDLGAVVSSQNSYHVEQNKWQQQDLLANVEFSSELGAGEFTAIAQLRWGAKTDYNHESTPANYSDWSKPLWIDAHGELSLREMYWELDTAHTSWRIGKQQVVWGKADGLKLLDVVNPMSFRQFILDDFDDSRIPIWMANFQWFLGDNSTLQMLWVPDATAHEIPPQYSPFAFTSPLVVPKAPAGAQVNVEQLNLPSDFPKDSDFGLRVTHFTFGWDLSFNYLYHYVDLPVLRTRIENQTATVQQSLERSHLVGASASTAVEDWTIRSEFAFETDRYFRTLNPLPGVDQHNQVSGLLGLDWQGWRDQYISIQWFHKAILNASDDLVEDDNGDTVTLLWDFYFLNETLKLQWMHIHSLSYEDGVLQPKVTYNFLSNLDLYIGADLFYGDEEGLYGQFEQASRVSIGFELGI